MSKLKNFWVAVGIIVISTLPYLHDVFEFPPGEYFGFSTIRVFYFMLLSALFAHLGWLFAFFEAKRKPYRFVLLVPVALSLYQIIIILAGLRESKLNEVSTKFIIILILSLVLILNYFIGKRKIDDQ